jgi:hypothetical protein
VVFDHEEVGDVAGSPPSMRRARRRRRARSARDS